MIVVGCIVHRLMCEEISRCYDDNFCLWTDGTRLNKHEAQTACQQRSDSFLPRITDAQSQSKLDEFRSDAWSLLGNDPFWIDVTAVSSNDFHWIDESSFAGFVVHTVRQNEKVTTRQNHVLLLGRSKYVKGFLFRRCLF